MKENPYLVGIEEMRIKCDENNREKVELDLTVSTFAKLLVIWFKRLPWASIVSVASMRPSLFWIYMGLLLD